jgi:hypothetical protein
MWQTVENDVRLTPGSYWILALFRARGASDGALIWHECGKEESFSLASCRVALNTSDYRIHPMSVTFDEVRIDRLPPGAQSLAGS